MPHQSMSMIPFMERKRTSSNNNQGPHILQLRRDVLTEPVAEERRCRGGQVVGSPPVCRLGDVHLALLRQYHVSEPRAVDLSRSSGVECGGIPDSMQYERLRGCSRRA